MQRLLIANRGEIAVRIARAARELGMHSIVVVSEADEQSLAARTADESIVIGPAPAARSYLDIAAVVAAARAVGADAVHPGYGFLSENADFAEAVRGAGLTWVGPAPEVIRLMGDKARARQAALAAGVPTIAGTAGALPPVDELGQEELTRLLEQVGLPLLIKASSGGGGRGIRRVDREEDFAAALATAQAEAVAAFGNGEVYLERLVHEARHVEVQILGDGRNAIHLGDRDCSLQRRRQKMVEESPAPGIPAAVRQQLLDSAVALAVSTGYSGAGTVEYLYDPRRHEAAFIEMNTRLQVEHPVTEQVTGLDLVREQLLIAAGQPLRHTQEDIVLRGHAIEVRINAEDPQMGFFPSPGTLERLSLPGGPGVRVDTGFASGDVVPPYYDSMLAKLIVHDEDRPSAIRRMLRALEELRVEGVRCNAAVLPGLLQSEEFREAAHHTDTVEQALTMAGARA